MSDTGEMSGWGLEVVNIMKQEIIWTKARQSKCSVYSGEEEGCGGGDEDDLILKVTWKLGLYL